MCNFIYIRNIDEIHFYNQTRPKDIDKNSLILRKKGYKCQRENYTDNYCKIHTNVILDRQEFFKEFLEWIDQDDTLNIDDFSYTFQKTLYRCFINKLEKILYLKRILGIPKGEMDFTDLEYQNIYLNCSKDKCFKCNKTFNKNKLCTKHLKKFIINYYKLLTINLRTILKNNGYHVYEKIYKVAYNEVHVIQK